MRYDVKVIAGTSPISVLGVDAEDRDSAVAEARRQGYSVLSVNSGVRWHAPRWRGFAKPFPLLLFAQELHSLLDAGLSLMESLESLAEKDQGSGAGRTLQDIMRRLREGRSFSQALAAQPAGVFPEFFVAMVRASERSGHLAESLGRFAAYQTQLDAVKKQVVSASIYPLLLAGTGSLVLAFLLAYVVPRFSRIFEESGVALNWGASLLVAWGSFVEAHGFALAAGLLAALTLAGWALAQSRVRARLIALLWRSGALGERLRVFQLGRFYRTLGMLVQGGQPLVPALELAAPVLPAVLRERLAAARREISEGATTSSAMEHHRLATPVALRMLRVGERSGNMGEMLERVAVFLDDETARWIDWFTRLFEPLLMVFIGLVIGTIVALMYMPIFELAGAIQ